MKRSGSLLRCLIRARPAIRLVVVVILAICASAAADVFVRKSGQSIEDFCKSNLPAGVEFAHPPLQVSLSPSQHNIVVLFRKADDVNTNYTGWVLVPGVDNANSYKKYELPSMDEIPGHFEINVQAVFGAAHESGTTRDLVVLYIYHRNGSTDDDGYACYVYHWNGEYFETLREVSRKLAGLRTATAVRSKLRALTK